MGDLGPGTPEAVSATRFPELNDLLTDFVYAVRRILADNLVGAYLTGSFALGGGERRVTATSSS